MTISESAQAMQEHLIELRRDFHAHPEISREEKETSERILRELRAIGGYEIVSGVNGCGIIAELNVPGSTKTVVLRADMDALQLTEETNLPFASENPGVMHGCGHDAHITMLLGAARLLAERRDALRCRVRLLFQPAEELAPVGGAKGMIAAGAMKDTDAVFGLHVWPGLAKGVFATKAGALMAASDHFTIRLTGRSAHGARPQDGIDTVVAGAQIVTALQSVVSRSVDPLRSAVITVGRFHAGTRYNIVAEHCELEGTVRTYDPAVRELCAERIRAIAEGIAAAMGCLCEIDYGRGYCAVENDPAMADRLLGKAAALFGEEYALRVSEPAMTAEDFAFYLKEAPGCFAWLGTDEPGKPSPPLHSNRMTVPEDILWRGSALLAGLALDM